MDQTPEIKTDCLRLRAFCRDDTKNVFTYVRNPNVLRYTTARTPHVLAETQEFVNGLVDKPTGAFAWAICLENNPRVIGAVEFAIPNSSVGKVDYALAEEYWNKGFMTETVRAIIDWAFSAYVSLDTVTSSAMKVNRASTRVMEKCGLVFLKNVQEKWEKFDEPVDIKVYHISRKKWENIPPVDLPSRE